MNFSQEKGIYACSGRQNGINKLNKKRKINKRLTGFIHLDKRLQKVIINTHTHTYIMNKIYDHSLVPSVFVIHNDNSMP